MRRTGAIFISVLAIIVAGCSRSVAPDSLVPIEFALDCQAKAAVFDETDLVGERFGVFAIDRNLALDDALFLYNREGYCADNGGDVVLSLSRRAFYPLVSETLFDFCTYYPYGSSVEIDGDRLYAKVTLAGEDDILYANDKRGYNAEVVRDGYKPSFHFTHVTAGLSFKISYEDIPDGVVSVESLQLKEVPVSARLCLADRTDGESLEGQFLEEGVVSDDVGVGGSWPVSLSGSGKVRLCDDVFVLPQENIDCTLKINGVEYNFTLNPEKLVSGLGGHKAGTLYTYLFVLDYSDSGIEVTLGTDVYEE